MSKRIEVDVHRLVGGGYNRFWTFRGRYRVVKGSRASKKSKTAALWYLYHLMKYPKANLLVVRKTYRTLKDSCFAELRWAAGRLRCEGLWRFRENPLEAEYLPTGQKIYFRGLDDPLKIASITAEVGCLCWLWIEEAYELSREADFDMLDESIRGACPDGLWKQITLTFNPWNERHWLKKRFFDGVEGKSAVSEDGQTLAMTVDYTCNEWLDEADLAAFARMRRQNPRRYTVAGLGGWGVAEGLIFENWREEAFLPEELRARHGDLRAVFGLDFGYTNDPTALFCGFVSRADAKLYVWDELYRTGLSNRQIYDAICAMGYGKERIVADSAEPKSIDELRHLGLRVRPARKGRDSVRNGIQRIQDLEIRIHPRCVSFLTEIGSYAWQVDRFDRRLNEPADGNDHLMDAMRYALEQQGRGRGWLI